MYQRMQIIGILVVQLVVVGRALGVCRGDGRTGYPEAWWKRVTRDSSVPDWEILPQEAGPCEVILSKRGELGILSNFAATPFELDGIRYASLEGFWQMMKYPESEADPRAKVPDVTWPYTRSQVGDLVGFDAKRAGEPGSLAMKKLGINYVTYLGQKLPYRTSERGPHYDVIVRATWAKVRQNESVKATLLKTGDLILRPDHVQEPDASPAWKYFEIYREIREQLREQKH